MNIIVCIKRVPMTQEADLEIDELEKDVKKDALPFVINDWDNYAIEEAVLLREKTGGTVTAVTIGTEEDEEILRRALAMGADKAIRIDPGDLGLDGFVTSRILAEVIKGGDYDLVLTGLQADDYNCGMVGMMLAEHLGIAHAAGVTGIEPEGREATIRVELEGGMDGVLKIRFPALMSVQTGINEPRYVSIMGIRKASKKELKVIKTGDLNLTEDDLAQRTTVEMVFLPPETEGAEIIEGDSSMVAEKIIRILAENGVSV
ncbi:MAG: electron transfer flavoprotein subunit beta/FixA family protein [Deltaproteobacteria bacterium]|nr:electron transfer flavoprotein subunit beta/FixA family protein [Deltaproteobacteria bacterium]